MKKYTNRFVTIEPEMPTITPGISAAAATAALGELGAGGAIERDHELGSFARGVLRDFAAEYAGLAGTWSYGPVEGQVNRLKMLKRQLYGRAKFDLLRLRVLYAH